jgi:hypothetical protein
MLLDDSAHMLGKESTLVLARAAELFLGGFARQCFVAARLHRVRSMRPQHMDYAARTEEKYRFLAATLRFAASQDDGDGDGDEEGDAEDEADGDAEAEREEPSQPAEDEHSAAAQRPPLLDTGPESQPSASAMADEPQSEP